MSDNNATSFRLYLRTKAAKTPDEERWCFLRVEDGGVVALDTQAEPPAGYPEWQPYEDLDCRHQGMEDSVELCGTFVLSLHGKLEP